ncbi:MAG: pilus assembly protein [Chloroflexi bacterium RBG_16_57_8]|nr:MAG: pilus assembly protein [Chloroflexi bacterium RBG_16_57_8]
MDFLNGVDSPQRVSLHNLIDRDEDICITGIVLTEVLQGIREDNDFERTREYLLAFPILDAKGAGTFISAAGICRDCRKAGVTVRKTVDCVIAAICLEHGLTLLHHDSDFDLIKECTGLVCYSA